MTPFKQARESIKTLIEAIPELAGVPVFLERATTNEEPDIEAAFNDALNVKGLAIVVLESDGGLSAQTAYGGAAIVELSISVGIVENVFVNRSSSEPASTKIPSEDAVYHLIEGLIGKPIGDGEIALVRDAFARISEQAGVIEHYVGFTAPVHIRGS